MSADYNERSSAFISPPRKSRRTEEKRRNQPTDTINFYECLKYLTSDNFSIPYALLT